MELNNVSYDFVRNGPMADTIRAMKDSGLHRWGFAIYKAAEITDDDTWVRYLDALKQDVHEELEHNGRDVLLEQYSSWPALSILGSTDAQQDDRSAVRANFQQWCKERLQEHQHECSTSDNDVAAAAIESMEMMPRFRYCLYVDQKCLDTLAAHASAKATRKRPGRGPPPPALVAMVIDAGEHQQAWEYYNLRYVAGLYEELHKTQLVQNELYVKPPAIGPLGFDSM